MSKGKNTNNRYDQLNNDTDSIIVIFHVLLPFNVNLTSYKPAVIGSCEVLGEWKTPKVWLRNISPSTLWISDPVCIPKSSNIEYKYCLEYSSYAGWRKEIKYDM
ncbi:9754_t:CDS:1, partial [Racocetra fulgida]